MSETDFDAQVARVMLGILQVRRVLAPEDLDALLGSVMAEIEIGLDVAEERAMEEAHRRPSGANVIRFSGARQPGSSLERNDQR